jgi:microcystin-dependent protein
MAEPFMAEIRIFAFSFPPKGWAFCDGQLMPLSQNTALFALLGTTYGGDGKSTFALPDLQDRAPMHPGKGVGLTLRDLGEAAGDETVTLLASEMPLHTHTLRGATDDADLPAPTATRSMGRTSPFLYQSTTNANLVNLASQALGETGGDQPHNNMMPYLTLNFCIAIQGIFPRRPPE